MSGILPSNAPQAVVGIDVGGSKIAAGLAIFPQGEIRAIRIIQTRPERGGAAVLADLIALGEEMKERAQKLGQEVQGIGIGICELVDPRGRILSENCIHWRDQPLAQALSRFGPVVIEADVRAAALGEALFGAGRVFGIFLYVTVGTGISCCLMNQGRPYTGAHGATGTMASSPLDFLCQRCAHIAGATLEDIASGPALVSQLNQRRPGIAQTGQEVLAAAGAGDPDALEIVTTSGRALGATIALLINILDPEAVIVGGGLGLADGPYWESFVESTRAHIWSEQFRNLPLLHAQTGENAGVIGAAAVAWKQLTPEA